MEDVQKEIHKSEMDQVRIVELGPKLTHIAEGDGKRGNIIRSKRIDPADFLEFFKIVNS
ncbi:hypothetical protein KKF11_02395 [Patescibacteria group bacterium]|nr:hypothetical protein [Patescibacteria group bacterium]